MRCPEGIDLEQAHADAERDCVIALNAVKTAATKAQGLWLRWIKQCASKSLAIHSLPTLLNAKSAHREPGWGHTDQIRCRAQSSHQQYIDRQCPGHRAKATFL